MIMLKAVALSPREDRVNRARRPRAGAAREGMAMLRRRTLIGLGLSGTALAAGGVVRPYYASALRRARERVAAHPTEFIPTRFGKVQYARVGSGPPVLMIHGSGGGFDQGLLFADPLIEAGYTVIAPSRFGYLGSDYPDDPSPENQADAFAQLLDALGLKRVPVIGGSAGALSALAFAIRHPDRCAALIPIVPAAYAPGRPPARPWSATETWLARSALQSDFLFWCAITLDPDRMTKVLLATDPALLEHADEGERDRVMRILDAILPVSDRAKGLLMDMQQAGDPKPMDLGTISAPTLAISLEDDLYLTADAARHIAASVKGARAIIYPTGGHVWVGRNREMFEAIESFIENSAVAS